MQYLQMAVKFSEKFTSSPKETFIAAIIQGSAMKVLQGISENDDSINDVKQTFIV